MWTRRQEEALEVEVCKVVQQGITTKATGSKVRIDQCQLDADESHPIEEAISGIGIED